MGGRRPPLIYGKWGTRALHPGQPATQGIFSALGMRSRDRVSQARVVMSLPAPVGVRAWCRGRGPAVFQLFTRSLLGSGRSLRVVGLVTYALNGIMILELAGDGDAHCHRRR